MRPAHPVQECRLKSCQRSLVQTIILERIFDRRVPLEQNGEDAFPDDRRVGLGFGRTRLSDRRKTRFSERFSRIGLGFPVKRLVFPIRVFVREKIQVSGLVLNSATWIPGLRYMFQLRNSRKRRNPAVLLTPGVHAAPPGMTTAETIVLESGRC